MRHMHGDPLFQGVHAVAAAGKVDLEYISPVNSTDANQQVCITGLEIATFSGTAIL